MNGERIWYCSGQWSHSDMCYKYRLSDQYIHQYSHKNIGFYSQRHSKDYPLCTYLKIPYTHYLNNSQANQTTGSKIKAHIPSFRPCACTLAWWGNQTLTPSLKTSGIYSLCYKTPPIWLHSAAATEMLPTVENHPMDHESCPPDIKHPLYPLVVHTSSL